jgi:hypothetical protein
VLPMPTRLPSAERRRSGAIVKLSLAVAEQACAMAGAWADPSAMATVFSSSSGDPVNCHALCEALAAPEPLISPTRFTNSVHNATAGYWHIATQSRAASTSLCGHDASFAAGLFEAVSQCVFHAAPVLLVASDIPYPEPLHALRPHRSGFGVALVLTPPAGGGAGAARPAGPRLAMRCVTDEAACTPVGEPALDALCRDVPSARSLPLLKALAQGGAARSMRLEGFGGLQLALVVEGAAA